MRSRVSQIGLGLWLSVALLSTIDLPGMRVAIATTANRAEQLVEQAASLYKQGQYSAAVPVWERAAKIYRANGDKLNEAMALSNLSLTYQQQGAWEPAKTAILASLKLLQPLPDRPEKMKIWAGALDIQGRWYLSTGDSQKALNTWQEATKLYRRMGDKTSELQSQVNQAQALQELGFYRKAAKLLTELEPDWQKQSNSLVKSVALRNLGNIRRLVGDLDGGQKALEQSLEVAKQLKSDPDISAALLGLGNVAEAQLTRLLQSDPGASKSENPPNDLQAALRYYEQAASFPVSVTAIQAQINHLHLLIKTEQWETAQTLALKIQPRLTTLPASRGAIASRIWLAQNLMQLAARNSQVSGAKYPTKLEIAQLLATTIQQSRTIGDRRMEAYGLGTLGLLYERNQQFPDAQNLTQQALVLSQSLDTPDLAYQWQWQLGRLLKAQGQVPEAIVAYKAAWKSLQSLRGDLVAINPDVQFSFRESVEPVYRELIALLLPDPSNKQLSLTKSGASLESNRKISEDSESRMKSAQEVIESLQIAELDNFLGQACIEVQKQLDQIIDRQDQSAAVIYPIILPDRLEILVKLPRQPLQRHTIAIAQKEVEKIAKLLREDLEVKSDIPQIQANSKIIYNWLVRPVEPTLQKSRVKTLVFVLDGSLRQIPMAALYDGRQYLIQKYQIALTPGFQIFNPKPLDLSQLNVLAGGISERRLLPKSVSGNRDFAALPNVKTELDYIQSKVSSRILHNEGFTSRILKTEINKLPFPIVHVASHGQFSSNPDDTYILAWDKTINVNELDSYLRIRGKNKANAIELLVLSACKTAQGDSRATLGIAGIAVRAGARSVLASLWNAHDGTTTVLMDRFYYELTTGKMNKASALRSAQLKLLQDPKYNNPYYWAPYVLVGNWL
jgi:CHAT domain-containing protein